MGRRQRWDLSTPVTWLDHGLCLALLATAVLALVLVGAGHPIAYAQKPPSSVSAEAVYKKHCQVCHVDGDSPLEPLSFVDGKWAKGSRLNDIVKVVSEGVPDTAMVSFKDILTPEEIRAVAEYVRALDKSLKPEKR